MFTYVRQPSQAPLAQRLWSSPPGGSSLVSFCLGFRPEWSVALAESALTIVLDCVAVTGSFGVNKYARSLKQKEES
jgi:hypothetical protein